MRADNLLNQGRYAEALALSRKRWLDVQAGGSPAEATPNALTMLALAELANGLPQPALAHARDALKSAHTSAPDSRREAFALTTLARATGNWRCPRVGRAGTQSHHDVHNRTQRRSS
ncbi:hypothetical protein [Thermomonas sp.]|uniref:hypothetical protein n=1 Tax=Thermomonas sp. TaxID=1971895 RepID=UPI00248A4B0C|nr:hypothetical protein [Thermomonas sp.]MDI1252316.1 hypothetical protein [Thermomonas sp.]